MNRTEQVCRLEAAMANLHRSSRHRDFDHDGGLSSSLHQAVLFLVTHFKDSDEPVSVSDVATEMNITNSAASQLVDILERKGIAKRARSEDDKRIVNIELTKRGKIAMKIYVKHRGHNFLDGLIEYLGPKDADELIRLMDRVAEYSGGRDRKCHR
jgi:DNA-binding MarR family transcriptional regulator